MSEDVDVERQWAGQCEAWWDAHACRPVSLPKDITVSPQLGRIMRCVLEAGHEPIAETAAAGGHNFGGLGPYTPGMPGWRAQQRALGLPDERGVDVSWEVPPGTPEWQREVWSRVEKVARDFAVDAIAEALDIQRNERQQPATAGGVALTMTPDAGRMFLKALIYAASRISPVTRAAGAEISHEDWLLWGANRLDAALRAAEPAKEGQER